MRIGALVPNSDLAYHPLIERRYPLLASAILAGASQQLRNMASTGGNLLQRTRCCYFYDTATPCNKREPGSGCPAIPGLNRVHAILGTSDACIATHPSDMCVALAALAATVHVTGPAGDRAIAFADFHRLPGDTPHRDTNLHAERDRHRDRAPEARLCRQLLYLKIRDRLSYAFALVSIAAALELDGDTIKEARLALGGVAHKPWRDTAAEAALRGQGRQPHRVRASGRPVAARRQGATAQHLQDRSRPPRHRSRTDPGRAGHAAIAVRQEDRVSNPMQTYIGTATSRVDGRDESHRRREICRRVQCARPRLWQRRNLDHRHGAASRASMPSEALARRRRARRPHPREPAAHGEAPIGRTRTTSLRTRFAVPPALRRQDPVQRPADRVGRLPTEWEIARFAASLVRVEYDAEAHVTDLFRRT